MRDSVSRLPLNGAKNLLWWFLFLIILGFSFSISKVDVVSLIGGLSNSIALIREMMPPNFSRWRQILSLASETVAMGFWGTMLGILFSLPLGFLAARNTSKNRFIYHLSRGLVTLLRSIPDVIYGFFFVTAFGLGPLAGVAALTMASVGLLGKFYSEAVESIDEKSVEALTATGSRSLSVIRHAIIPQVQPLFMGYNLYMLDHNIRVALTLGVIGAGGLGVELFTQMRAFHYQKAAAILVIMVVIIIIIDRASSSLRNKIINGGFWRPETRIQDTLLFVVIGVFILISLIAVPAYPKELIAGVPRIWTFLKGMTPPDFSRLSIYLRLMVETVAMGISGTFIAIILGGPLGVLAARNVTRNSIIYNLAKELTNFLRATPDLVFALIFVVAVGLGPFAGVLALGLNTAGFLGKFYAEAIENIDPKPVEAVEASGGTFLHRISHSIIPQVLPLFNSYNLYILDRNIRYSTIMGLVGAGGIGFELVMTSRMFEYRQMSAMLIIILATIMLVDWLSSFLRKKVV
jgi:phosphonate transport system permease protein